jgi:hypothetical protein
LLGWVVAARFGILQFKGRVLGKEVNRLQVIRAYALTAGFAFVIGFGIGHDIGKNAYKQAPMASRIRKIAGSPDDLSKCNPAHVVGASYCFDWYEAF